ncbi:MAG: glycosyltransferase family 2 protein [Bacteroidaceae bacterium]|nr:glycosyltransferase family 2 protein [Bacteroidaceae bacterium]
MNTIPKVSIIIPVYKAEPYIEDCVQTILRQTFTDFEVLLIDDGSPDRSGEICDRIASQDLRVKVFHKPNGGATSARKFGVEHAIGEWILFSDADDEMPADAISNLMKYDDGKNEFIAGTILYQSIDRLIKTKTDKASLSPKEYICQLLDRTTYYGPCSKLIKRQLFDGLEWLDDKDVFQNEDLLMLILITSRINSNVAICNEGIHYVCISREGSASSRTMGYIGCSKLMTAIQESLFKAGIWDKTIMESYVNYCIWTLNLLCISSGIILRKDSFLSELNNMISLVSIHSENIRHAKHVTSRTSMYMAIYVRRIKNQVKKILQK